MDGEKTGLAGSELVSHSFSLILKNNKGTLHVQNAELNHVSPGWLVVTELIKKRQTQNEQALFIATSHCSFKKYCQKFWSQKVS